MCFFIAETPNRQNAGFKIPTLYIYSLFKFHSILSIYLWNYQTLPDLFFITMSNLCVFLLSRKSNFTGLNSGCCDIVDFCVFLDKSKVKLYRTYFRVKWWSWFFVQSFCGQAKLPCQFFMRLRKLEPSFQI